MEKLARIFFVFTLLFAAAFITFFLLYAQVKNEVTQSKVDRAGLQQSLSTLENESGKQAILYEELQRKYDLLAEEAAEKSDLNVQALKDQIYDQQKQIEDQSRQLEEKEQEIDSLKLVVDLKPVQDTINASVINLNPNTDQLAEISAEYEKEIKKLQNEIIAQKAEVTRLTEELETAADGDQRIKDLQERVGQTQQSLETAISQAKALEDQLNERNRTIDNLNEQLSNAENSTKLIAEKQTEIASLNQEISRLNDAVANEVKKTQVAEEEIAGLNDELNSKMTEIRTLEATLEREKKYDPIPAGEADAVRYKYLLLGEDALSAGNDVQSAEYFSMARLDDLALGDLHQVYERKRELAYQKAIVVYYNDGYQLYKDKKYEQAIEKFSKAAELAVSVKTDYFDDALYYRALSEYTLSDYSAAETDFDKITETQQGSNYVQHSLYYLCKILEAQGRKEELKKVATELVNYSTYSDYAKKILAALN